MKKSNKQLFNWRLYVLSSDLPPTTRHVLLTLSTHMDEWGKSAFPTNDQMAYETGLSRQSINKHIGLAVKAGWLKQSLHGFGGQKWRSSEYTPLIPEDAEITPWKDTEEYRKSQARKSRKKDAEITEGCKPDIHPLQEKGSQQDIQPQDKGCKPKTPKVVNLSDKGCKPNASEVVNEVDRSSSLSSSVSSSISSSGTGQEKKPAKSTATWQAYSAAYRQRHQVEPVRNKKVNSQLCQLVDRVGDNAPAVAEFYVFHNNSFYVQKMHSVDMLLSDAESLHAQWLQGRQMTQTQARQTDKSQNNLSVVQSVIDKRQILEHGE